MFRHCICKHVSGPLSLFLPSGNPITCILNLLRESNQPLRLHLLKRHKALISLHFSSIISTNTFKLSHSFPLSCHTISLIFSHKFNNLVQEFSFFIFLHPDFVCLRDFL